jgi:hypothetical protein
MQKLHIKEPAKVTGLVALYSLTILLTNRNPVELELFLCCFHHDIHMIAADTGEIIHPASSCFALLPIHATSLPVLHVYLYEASQ